MYTLFSAYLVHIYNTQKNLYVQYRHTHPFFLPVSLFSDSIRPLLWTLLTIFQLVIMCVRRNWESLLS